MKKQHLLFITVIICLVLLAACSSGKEEDKNIVGPDGHPVTDAPSATRIPSVSPTPTATPTPSPSPSPSPTPTPTPIPVFEDIITETEEPGLYDVPHGDYEGYFLNVHTLHDKLLYFENEGIETPPKIISYCISTGESKDITFEDIDAYAYEYKIIDDKYIVVIIDSREFTFYDEDLKKLYSFTIPIDSTHPEYTASNDYSKIYYIKGRTLYECSTKTGIEKELKTDLKFAEAYPTGVSSDGRYLKLYMYTRKVGYYQLHLFDLETNELSYPEDYSHNYFYSISPDMTEVLVSAQNIPAARLYDTDENIEDFIFLLNSGEDLPEEKPKTDIKINSSAELASPFIDWERRLFITTDDYYRNSMQMQLLTCYSIDTGEPVSNCIIPLETPASQYPVLSFDAEKGYILISGCILKEPFCYAWDYANDDFKDESASFVRYDYIPKYLDTYRKELEEKYHIFIYLGTEIFATEHDYTLTYSGDFLQQYETLHTLDEIFSIYPADVFEQMKYDGLRTIGIYLCNGFTKKASYGIENAVALAGFDGYERFLALDISYWGDMRANIIHEISHWLDKKIEYYGTSTGEYDFSEVWNANNPEDFYYMDDYNKTSPFSRYVCYYTTNVDNYYFLDTYSLSKATEDRARLFEYLMRYNGNEYFQSEHMRAKLHTYFDYLRKSFDTTNWPEETIWEYKLKMLDRYYSGDQNVTLEDIYPEYFNGEEQYSLTDDGFGFLSAYSNSVG